LKSAEYGGITDDGLHWRDNVRTEYQYDAAGSCSRFSQYDWMGMEVGRNEYEFSTGKTLISSSSEMLRPNVYNNVHAYEREHWYTVMEVMFICIRY